MNDFNLTVEPNDKIVFASKELGDEPVVVMLKVTNTTKKRQACKIKCTSNAMFRIRPPVFALNADEAIDVKLTFKAGNAVPDSGKHYFVVYYINAPDEKIAPRVCWSEHKKEPAGSKRLYVDFKQIKDGVKGKDKKEKEMAKDEKEKELAKGEKEKDLAKDEEEKEMAEGEKEKEKTKDEKEKAKQEEIKDDKKLEEEKADKEKDQKDDEDDEVDKENDNSTDKKEEEEKEE